MRGSVFDLFVAALFCFFLLRWGADVFLFWWGNNSIGMVIIKLVLSLSLSLFLVGSFSQELRVS